MLTLQDDRLLWVKLYNLCRVKTVRIVILIVMGDVRELAWFVSILQKLFVGEIKLFGGWNPKLLSLVDRT